MRSIELFSSYRLLLLIFIKCFLTRFFGLIYFFLVVPLYIFQTLAE